MKGETYERRKPANWKPTLGGPDPSMPDREDHERHLRLVMAAAPRGFAWLSAWRR